MTAHLDDDDTALEKKISRNLVADKYDETFETNEWLHRLPYLKFRDDWLVCIIPPFMGAIIRFKIRKITTKEHNSVSVYFDGYNHLGYVGEPYWEIYPIDGGIDRFPMGAEDAMLDAIEQALISLEAPR